MPQQGNVVPVRARFVDDCETPVSAFLKLRAGEPEGSPCFLLESAEQGQVGRYSFVGIRPRSVLRWSDGVALRERRRRDVEAPDPYAAVAEYLARFRPAPVEGLPPFAGGAVGFFGYDLVRTVEPLGEPNPDPLGLPDMALMVTDVLLVFDHLRHELTIMACAFADDEGGDRRRLRARRGGDRRRRARRLRGAVPAPEQPVASPSRPASPPTWSARSSKRRSSGSSSTSTPATPSRSSPRSASRRRPRSRPSRSTAACARSTPRPTCTSSSSATSRSPAPRPSRWSRSPATGSRRGRSPAPTRAAPTRRRTAASPSASSTTPRSGPST